MSQYSSVVGDEGGERSTPGWVEQRPGGEASGRSSVSSTSTDHNAQSGVSRQTLQALAESTSKALPCRMKFGKGTENRLFAGDHSWDDRELDMPPTTSLFDLNRHVYQQVVDILASDVALLQQARDRMAVVCFDIEFRVHDRGWRTPDIEVTHAMTANIGDLFSYPHSGEVGLQVLVWLRWDPEEDIITDSSVRQPRDLAKGLVQRRQTEHEHSYFRIGTHELLQPDQSERQSTSNKVQIAKTLTAHYDETGEHVNQAIDLRNRAVRAWGFGAYCIGDPDGGRSHGFVEQEGYRRCGDRQDTNLAPFGEATDLQKLDNIAVQLIDANAPDPGSGVPFMPSHSLNVFDPADYEFGRLPKGHIDAVVRPVSRVTVGYNGEKHDPEVDDPGAAVGEGLLPKNVEIEVSENDGPEDIRHCLEDAGRDCAKHDALERKLLTTEGQDKLAKDGWWELCLWVLPQGGRRRKMHRFPTQRPGTVERF